MKTKMVFLTVLCLAMSLSACRDVAATMEYVSFRIAVDDGGSRCTSVDDSEESAVGDLQVFVFGSSGALEAYGHSSASSLTLDCMPGSKDVWAVVNAPSLSAVRGRDELATSVSDLGDNSAGHLVMAGHRQFTLDGDMHGYVPVQRLCAKVVLGRIVRAFTSDVLQARQFVVKRIYLTNVAGQCCYGHAADMDLPDPDYPGSFPSRWYNKMGFQDDVCWLVCDSPSVNLTDEYSVTHTFYAYPNPFLTGARAGVWSPRTTRLVIETELDGVVGYYVVDVPGIESNHAYVFDSIELCRPGSDNPETVSSEDQLRFGFRVAGWRHGSEYEELL